jgi:hypothetical protein
MMMDPNFLMQFGMNNPMIGKLLINTDMSQLGQFGNMETGGFNLNPGTQQQQGNMYDPSLLQQQQGGSSGMNPGYNNMFYPGYYPGSNNTNNN